MAKRRLVFFYLLFLAICVFGFSNIFTQPLLPPVIIKNSNFSNFIVPVVKYHRVAGINTAGVDWNAIEWDLNVPKETTFGFSLADNNAAIITDFEGIVQIYGCVHSLYNGVGSAEIELAVRVLVDGVEARCLQASELKVRQASDIGTLLFNGTAWVEKDSNITVQYIVSNTDLDLESDPIFDKPVTASIAIEYISGGN